jgi:hypothetical protein
MHASFSFELGVALPASGGKVRQQIKWIAFAASLMAILFVVTLVGGGLLTPGTTDAAQPL